MNKKSLYQKNCSIEYELKMCRENYHDLTIQMSKLRCKKDKEIADLKEKLKLAIEYLKEGKAKFAPNTTNSLVDEFITRTEQDL